MMRNGRDEKKLSEKKKVPKQNMTETSQTRQTEGFFQFPSPKYFNDLQLSAPLLIVYDVHQRQQLRIHGRSNMAGGIAVASAQDLKNF